MIRQASESDLDFIEEGYQEHFLYEKEHGAYTVFKEGIYPTRKDAEEALKQGSLFVCEENGAICGSIIIDRKQPDEYRKIDWPGRAADDKVIVIHLLMVRPCMAGKGIGSSLVSYALETAGLRSCEAVRLDTGAQNTPAASLYRKMGFRLAGNASMKVGGEISHNGHLFFEKIL